MVTITSPISWKEVEQRVRNTTLLHDRTVYPYKNAVITLKEIPYSTVRTTSLYIARNLLAVQQQIAEDIGRDGYDPLALDKGLVLSSTDEQGNPIDVTLVPPIVEETDEYGMYLLDGSHRANLGLQQGRTSFMAIHITNIDPAYPAYAYPNDWSDVITYDVPPTEPALRKRYRAADELYKLYRDFGPLNGSQPRYGS